MTSVVWLLALYLCAPLPVAAASPSEAPRRRVLLSSVDGLRGDLLATGPAPNLRGIFTCDPPWCAHTYDARTHSGPRFGGAWVTAPGHTTMLTGVDIDRTGVLDNDTWLTFAQTAATFPSVLRRALESGYKVAAVGTPNAVHHGPVEAEQRAGLQNTSEPPHNALGDDQQAVAWAQHYIGVTDADLVFLHFDSFDHVGHRFGWGSWKQRAQLRDIDALFATLINFIAAQKSFAEEDWLLVLAADHGGHWLNHNHRQGLDDRIPLMLAKQGGRATPLGAGALAPNPKFGQVWQGDVAPTIMEFLGIAAGATLLDGVSQLGG